jgi:UDP:flavonoid glycosyltransferase YjiC (YdhE family)
MKIAFLTSDKPREHILADAFLMGARRHGHETLVLPLKAEPEVGPYDVACMVGVKSRELFRLHHKAGIPTIYFDKGYSRGKSNSPVAGWEYWRVAINHHHPTARLGERLPDDRLRRLGLHIQPWRRRGKRIIVAGSSAKYHEFYGLSEPTRYAEKLIAQLRELSGRPIVYRPKPSWREAVPVDGAAFSRPPESLDNLLRGAHVLITHGSNSCFEAALAGIPSIVLGEGVAKPISSTKLEAVEAPFVASDRARRQWLAALAYWQWTHAEMASGQAWEFLGKELHENP